MTFVAGPITVSAIELYDSCPLFMASPPISFFKTVQTTREFRATRNLSFKLSQLYGTRVLWNEYLETLYQHTDENIEGYDLMEEAVM